MGLRRTVQTLMAGLVISDNLVFNLLYIRNVVIFLILLRFTDICKGNLSYKRQKNLYGNTT